MHLPFSDDRHPHAESCKDFVLKFMTSLEIHDKFNVPAEVSLSNCGIGENTTKSTHSAKLAVLLVLNSYDC